MEITFVIHKPNSIPFTDEEGRIKVYVKDKYQLAKYFKVDFGCDIDEFEEDRDENIVKFLERDEILEFFEEIRNEILEKFKDKNIIDVNFSI